MNQGNTEIFLHMLLTMNLLVPGFNLSGME